LRSKEGLIILILKIRAQTRCNNTHYNGGTADALVVME
jgi:hypothetical protein